MEPPPQPPPWKRASTAAIPAPAPPAAASGVGFTPCLAPLSPPRLLTPRVSWSEIVSNSKESVDEEDQNQRPATAFDRSPRTPLPKCRRPLPSADVPPSPPQRASWRRRPPSDDEGDGRSARDQNEGRFAREFCEVEAIGRGQFSTVYRAKHCIDQCVYAVKKTTQISRVPRQSQLNEVFALASVAIEAANCPNIVRYFSSWLEDGRLHIQTELCECSLRDCLARRCLEVPPREPRFLEKDIVKVLLHVARGLRVLHGKGYVHLDIKPDNILLTPGEDAAGVYKIADLGLAAAALGSGCDDISEGDCRYLAMEVLRGNLNDLPKADIFSLGLVCYELGANPKVLPCNGEDWQRLRDGPLDVTPLLPMSDDFLELLRSIVGPDTSGRPTCEEIIVHPRVAPVDGLEAMRAKMRQSTLEAERYKQVADTYWHEMLSMKRQELLGGGIVAGSTGASAMRRGRTF